MCYLLSCAITYIYMPDENEVETGTPIPGAAQEAPAQETPAPAQEGAEVAAPETTEETQ